MAELKRTTGVLLLILCVPAIWSLYIEPEHSSNQLDTLEMKMARNEYGQLKTHNSSLRQQSVKYPINANGDTYPTNAADSASNGQTNNAVLAKTSQLRHHTSYDKTDDVVGVNGNNNENTSIFENSEAQSSSSLSPSTDAGEYVENRENSQLHSRQRRELSDWLIAPNTRWCGRGNTANGTYNHLGGASRADKCCRKHDHCKLFIPAMSNRYGLFNYRPYTLSHCNCDIRFRTCLKMAGDEDADTIGRLFFNMVDTQCFVLTKEHICQQRNADGTCAQEHIKKKAQLRNNKRF